MLGFADVFAVTQGYQAVLEEFMSCPDGKSTLAYTMLIF